MGLIASPRHTKRDLERWEYWQRVDVVEAERWTDAKMLRAMVDMREFASERCYAGVSWGKDSTVLAHLVSELATESGVVIPLVWVRVKPIENPDCEKVRDAFLQRFPHIKYDEIVVWCKHDSEGWHARGTLEKGFRSVYARYGRKHVSGVRAAESGTRKMRMKMCGVATENSCAPIGWWTAQDVWTHLHVFDLPVHPAYACSVGGMLDRDRIRVSSLGGRRGDGWGRTEWEQRYYRDEMRVLES